MKNLFILFLNFCLISLIQGQVKTTKGANPDFLDGSVYAVQLEKNFFDENGNKIPSKSGFGEFNEAIIEFKFDARNSQIEVANLYSRAYVNKMKQERESYRAELQKKHKGGTEAERKKSEDESIQFVFGNELKERNISTYNYTLSPDKSVINLFEVDKEGTRQRSYMKNLKIVKKGSNQYHLEFGFKDEFPFLEPAVEFLYYGTERLPKMSKEVKGYWELTKK